MDNAFDLSFIDELYAEPEPIVIPTKSRIASKIVARLAAGAVSSVVVSIIHQNTTTYSKTQKVQLYVGAYVLGAMVADKAQDYVADKTASTFAALENFLWIPVDPDVTAPTEPTDLEVLIQAIPDKQ